MMSMIILTIRHVKNLVMIVKGLIFLAGFKDYYDQGQYIIHILTN